MNLHEAPPPDPSALWGLLKDRQGAQAVQTFRGKLPERYQKLLEDYYQGLSRATGGARPQDPAAAPEKPAAPGPEPGTR
jgi:hypothetical protein